MTTVGMIGAGRWGGNWIRTLAALPGTQLRWVCDVSPASLEKIRQQFPHVKTTTRLDDLLEDKTLDGIVIATIANGMGLVGLSAQDQDIVTALVLLAAAAVDAVARRNTTRS